MATFLAHAYYRGAFFTEAIHFLVNPYYYVLPYLIIILACVIALVHFSLLHSISITSGKCIHLATTWYHLLFLAVVLIHWSLQYSNLRGCNFMSVAVKLSYNTDSTLLGCTLFYSLKLFLFSISHIFDNIIKCVRRKVSQLDAAN